MCLLCVSLIRNFLFVLKTNLIRNLNCEKGLGIGCNKMMMDLGLMIGDWCHKDQFHLKLVDKKQNSNSNLRRRFRVFSVTHVL